MVSGAVVVQWYLGMNAIHSSLIWMAVFAHKMQYEF